ncbi:phosphate regulon sensor histidine kinase PhoR ['Osedax' symbiont bacterium Rs2_46_30_T18]|nr:phosphate regulon sensor histidine kinase PhoR ['Osedax' symbiont bacterium Rs2_46_30_T18]
MAKSPYRALSSFFITVGVAALLGWIIDWLAWSLVIALFFWSVLQLREKSKLQLWLQQGLKKEPPEARGDWGEIFDQLYRFRKQRRRREKELLEVISRFQQSSAALKDAVVIVDPQLSMQWWNRSAERLLGLKKDSDHGQPLFNLLRDPRFIRYFQRADYTEPLQLKSPHDANIELQYSITEFGESERLLVARDISHLIRLEQTRQDFVANASHELRTPLTVIRGYLETFLDQPLSRPLHKAMGQMQQQSNRMQSLVEDLLLLSKLDSTDIIMDESPVNVPTLILTIMESAQHLAADKEHNISVDLAENIGLLAREKELHSAFSNLVYNAVRYTPTGGNIHISWSCDATGGYFTVADNGPGISSIHLDRLTERFYRVDDDRSVSTGGTGLGLAIVKNVLSRHQANLLIDSTVGEGSSFSCHFPLDTLTEL